MYRLKRKEQNVSLQKHTQQPELRVMEVAANVYRGATTLGQSTKVQDKLTS